MCACVSVNKSIYPNLHMKNNDLVSTYLYANRCLQGEAQKTQKINSFDSFIYLGSGIYPLGVKAVNYDQENCIWVGIHAVVCSPPRSTVLFTL